MLIIGNTTGRTPAPLVGITPTKIRPRPGGLFFGPRMRYLTGAGIFRLALET